MKVVDFLKEFIEKNKDALEAKTKYSHECDINSKHHSESIDIQIKNGNCSFTITQNGKNIIECNNKPLNEAQKYLLENQNLLLDNKSDNK